jgi:tetratricopeptide (TPR) repeat protein
MRTPLVPKAVFDEIIALVSAGELAGAEALCRTTLANHPRDVNVLGLLGAVLVKLERNDEAEAALRSAIEIAPTFAKPYEDLGFLLLKQDRAADAVPVLERATHLDPKLENAWYSLGKALVLLGRGEEADRAFDKCFELSPEKRLMALAAEHQREGRFDEAERLYRRVLRQRPNNVDALRFMASLAARVQKFDEAERLLERAIAIAPDFTMAILDLGRLRKEQDRYADALECFDRVLAADPGNAQAHFLRASTLAPAAFTYEAIDAFRRCLALRPRHAGALLGFGHVLKAVGKVDEAVEAYNACIRERPDQGETYWSLANLKTYRFDDATVAEMEQRLERGGLSVQSEVNFQFALAKAHEDRGDYERSWRHYRLGNERQRGEANYDPVQTESTNDRLIEVFSREFLAANAGQGHEDRSPIFILGLPRSGSTLLEQIIASHPQVEGTSELPYASRVANWLNRNRKDGINYPEAVRELKPVNLRALGSDYLGYAAVHRKAGTPRFIDKMPNNFPHVGFLSLILPNAKIIDARRHPLDACVSCYRQLFAKGQNWSYDLTELGEYYLQYQRLMDHWHAAAPGRVLTVQYEAVVADLESQVRRILEFCELPWDDACLRFYESGRTVRTPSSEQVRQPIYDRSIGHWRHFERHLDELVEIIEPIRDRYRQYERPAAHSRK